MHKFLFRGLFLFSALLIVGCKTDQSTEPNAERNVERNAEPKTYYGQSVDKAKKASNAVSAHDDAMRRQADQLGEN